ncbi:MAG: NlpC/P60 family protein [Rhizobiaceae bacterium]
MNTSFPTLDPLDRRLNLLDGSGKLIESAGTPAAINVAFTELREQPANSCAIDTQLMFGETVKVHDIQDGWAWVQADRDNYVGWLEASVLVHEPKPATHLVSVPRTFFYPEPDLKLPHKGMRSMGSALRVVGETDNRGTHYVLLETGEAVIASHIRPIGQNDEDFVSVAGCLIHTPYLWAGTTAFGLDCSGLVKLSLFMCGKNVLRDSDMQAATIGEEVDAGANYENVERGDFVFWRGHVGICEGPDQHGIQMFLHANGHTMSVTREPLAGAIERIAYLYENPIGVRRN